MGVSTRTKHMEKRQRLLAVERRLVRRNREALKSCQYRRGETPPGGVRRGVPRQTGARGTGRAAGRGEGREDAGRGARAGGGLAGC